MCNQSTQSLYHSAEVTLSNIKCFTFPNYWNYSILTYKDTQAQGAQGFVNVPPVQSVDVHFWDTSSNLGSRKHTAELLTLCMHLLFFFLQFSDDHNIFNHVYLTIVSFLFRLNVHNIHWESLDLELFSLSTLLTCKFELRERCEVSTAVESLKLCYFFCQSLLILWTRID